MERNDDLRRAIDALTIARVWEAAGLAGPIPQGDGVGKSPFRDERTGSFSISKSGKVWRDFGGTDADKGGVWQFAKRCWPNLSGRELAIRLIELSGIVPTPADRPPAAGTSSETSADPRLVKAAKALERRERKQAAEDALWRARDEAMRPPELQPGILWPDCVRVRFEEGIEAMRREPERVRKLAADRGWPEEWVWELLEQGRLSMPLEPMYDAEGNGARRQIAFRVEWPAIRGSDVELIPTGYHQRFIITREGQAPEKKWRFVPSIPRPGWRSEFQRSLVAHAEGLGLDLQERPSMVSPQPFVLGDLKTTKLLILLEGQWDAISLYGACGWFHDTSFPEGVAVAGIRGVQGVSAFLGGWWRWLQRVEPNVWAIADNDRAGSAWRDAPEAEPGRICPPSFAERLRYVGCRQIKISWLKPEHGGKDFNDYFKAKKPTQEQMLARIDATGLRRAAS